MKIKTPKRWIAGLVLAAIAVSIVSPAAQADRGHGRRYKGGSGYYNGPVARRVSYAPRPVFVERRSNAGPLIAGLIGGLVIGTAIAHASQPVAVQASYDYNYYDPYCEESFATLDIYQAHLRCHHHPRMVRVIEVDDGQCVDTYRWHEGGWSSCRGNDWDE